MTVSSGNKRERVFRTYVRSLLWISILLAIGLSIKNITYLSLFDFIHINPHRSQSNAILMMFIFIPPFAILALIGCSLVFGPSLAIQSITYSLWVRSGRIRAYLVVLTLLPALSALTWYCWDYLTPTDFNLGINVGEDWQPYEHGISLSRYLSTLAFQAPVSLFSLIYVDLKSIRKRKILILACMSIAVLIGIVEGHHQAEQQYKFTAQRQRQRVSSLASFKAL